MFLDPKLYQIHQRGTLLVIGLYGRMNRQISILERGKVGFMYL